MSTNHTDRSAEEFDPYSFAERWYMEHPEVLDEYLRKCEALDRIRRRKSNVDD